MESLLAERDDSYAARRTSLLPARLCVRVLGTLSLLLSSLAFASPAAAAPGRPTTDAAIVDDRASVTGASADRDVDSGMRVARAESRERRRAEPQEAAAETGLEPSAEAGLQFEGELELRADWLKNIALGQRPRDDVRDSEEELTLGLSYRPSERFLAFGEIKLVADQVVFADDTPRISEEAIERGEMWLLLKRVFDSRYSVQIGRQNFFEPRLWWWDDDLDAARFYYAQDSWNLYVGIAEELARTSTSQDFIAPNQEDVQRLLGHVTWVSSRAFNLGGFLLYQRDNSGSPPVDSVIETVRADESDADLGWVGLRAAGDIGLSRAGTLAYRADAGLVSGDETLVEFEDEAPGLSRVSAVRKRRVRGWGVDVGALWALPWRAAPTLNLIYAYGSGDKNLNDDTDRAFRQTGLQDQDEEFREYGVVLRPELSNLRIATLALRFPLPADTHLTLGYHRFRQVYPAPFVREARLDIQPTGQNKDIGEETSLVLQLRKWENLEIDLIAGSFKAGNAYGTAAGRRAERFFFKLIYEF